MTNTITASIEFYFKGEAYKPSLELDLDHIMSQYGHLPDLYPLLAEQQQIDNYSYEYEMMLSVDIDYSEPSGLAEQCLTDGKFNHNLFIQLWHESQLMTKLNPILKQQLNIEDIEQHPELKKVLMHTYKIALNKE